MSPLGQELVRDVPTLAAGAPLGTAIATLVESGLPALPVCGEDGKLVGVFGERNVIMAVLPGYVGEFSSAAFLSAALDEALEQPCRVRARPGLQVHERPSTSRCPADFSYAQLAETFLHHRVAVLPVVEDGRVTGAVTRRDYVRALAEKLPTG